MAQERFEEGGRNSVIDTTGEEEEKEGPEEGEGDENGPEEEEGEGSGERESEGTAEEHREHDEE